MSDPNEVAQRFCPKCGKGVDFDARFCKYCAFNFETLQRARKVGPITENQPPKKSKLPFLIGGIILLVLLLIIVGFVAVASFFYYGMNSDSAPTNSSPVTKASPQPPSLNDEAVSEVRELWEQHTAKCGDSYYGLEELYGITHEYKDVSFVARRTGPNTDADRLNGILWNGDVRINVKLYRDRENGTWTEWRQWTNPTAGMFQVGATKRQSGWSVVQLMHITSLSGVNCSEIPP
jgi:hypothetical protein